jgi:hypothetical protein
MASTVSHSFRSIHEEDEDAEININNNNQTGEGEAGEVMEAAGANGSLEQQQQEENVEENLYEAQFRREMKRITKNSSVSEKMKGNYPVK